WRVIAYNSDGSKKLLADKIYTTVTYYADTSTRALDGKAIYPNNYKYSNIRAYLNSSKNQFVTDGGTATSDDIDWSDKGFYSQAFTEAEKAKIKTVLVDNSAATTGSNTNQYACENTEDKVYLLSYKESQKKLYGMGSSAERIMMPTEYAKANGPYVSITKDSSGYWWLRSPIYGSSIYASYISPDGGHRGSDDGGVYWTSGGVVPALSVTE
ncbi:MAG: hypothetical protein HUK25_05645, partial [Treponema sp.]|nr:hypothetical protein [Treponema sp.]